MTFDESLNFLQSHQPMPEPIKENNPIFEQYSDVMDFFQDHYDERCVPLFLNSFGPGDGHGMYQMVEDIIRKYPHELVANHIRQVLQSGTKDAKLWCMQISSYFPDSEIKALLEKELESGDPELVAFAEIGLTGQSE